MKRYRVQLVEDAEQDLIDIYRYVATHDTVEKAAVLLGRLESLRARLAGYPSVDISRLSWAGSV